MFYIGSLEAASQEAFYGKARDVSKLTDVYQVFILDIVQIEVLQKADF